MHMRPTRLLSALTVFVALASGAPGAQPKTVPELDRLAAEFVAAYNSGDAERVASFYDDDAVTMPPNRPMTRGKTAIAAVIRRNLEHDPATMTLTPLESSIDGPHAYEAGARTMRWASGLTLQEKYVRIYKRVGDRWLIAYWIWNTDTPASPPR